MSRDASRRGAASGSLRRELREHRLGEPPPPPPPTGSTHSYTDTHPAARAHFRLRAVVVVAAGLYIRAGSLPCVLLQLQRDYKSRQPPVCATTIGRANNCSSHRDGSLRLPHCQRHWATGRLFLKRRRHGSLCTRSGTNSRARGSIMVRLSALNPAGGRARCHSAFSTGGFVDLGLKFHQELFSKFASLTEAGFDTVASVLRAVSLPCASELQLVARPTVAHTGGYLFFYASPVPPKGVLRVPQTQKMAEADADDRDTAEETAGTSEKPKRKKDQYRRDKPWDVDGAPRTGQCNRLGPVATADGQCCNRQLPLASGMLGCARKPTGSHR